MENNRNENNTEQQQQQPSLVGGHVQYVKGTLEETIGNISGSEAWKASGQQDKQAATASMQRAGEQRDPSQGYGKLEEVAGKVTGCEGMRNEGAASQKKD